MRRILLLVAVLLSFLPGFAGKAQAQAVIMTEFLAENRDGLLDEDEESSD